MPVDPAVTALADSLDTQITPEMLATPHRSPARACLLLTAAWEAQQHNAPEDFVSGLLARAMENAVTWTRAHLTAQQTGAWPYGGPPPEMEPDPLALLEEDLSAEEGAHDE